MLIGEDARKPVPVIVSRPPVPVTVLKTWPDDAESVIAADAALTGVTGTRRTSPKNAEMRRIDAVRIEPSLVCSVYVFIIFS
jgi:hypothetical protein